MNRLLAKTFLPGCRVFTVSVFQHVGAAAPTSALGWDMRPDQPHVPASISGARSDEGLSSSKGVI